MDIQLGGIMATLYIQNPERFKEMMVIGETHRRITARVYKVLVKDGSIKRLEDLSEEGRTTLWTDAKKLADGRLSNDDCIELAKALHTLSILSQQ